MFLELDGETKPARPFDAMMERAKRIYILIIKVDNLFSFFSSRCFLKEMVNMYSVFLWSYRNTHESLGELDNFPSIESRYMFSISEIQFDIYFERLMFSIYDNEANKMLTFTTKPLPFSLTASKYLSSSAR